MTRVPIKSTKRIQACLIKFPRSHILWVNSYFPTDPQEANFDDSELREVLAAIRGVIESSDCDDILSQNYSQLSKP